MYNVSYISFFLQTVTFQLIFVSDGTCSYSFYAYKADAMTITTGNVFIGEIVDGEAVGVFGTVVNDDYYRKADMIEWREGGEIFFEREREMLVPPGQQTPPSLKKTF